MYKGYTTYGNASDINQKATNIIEANGNPVIALADDALTRHAEIYKDGGDLVLETAESQTIIQNYYTQETSPNLIGSDGTVLTPKLVQSFLKSDPQYADNGSLTDESPVGAVHEINGEVTITRLDGQIDTAEIGTPIYQGDIVETAADAAVNITFIDETNFAVSGDSRLSIDEYVFDPSSNEGASDFSILKGVFVYTSGMIGREDPDDVHIDTPMGSIGIRGTIIAGNADSGEITVVEGAIVLRDLHGNEMTLANQFETAKFEPSALQIKPLGQLSAEQVHQNFESVSDVSGDLFSSIQDTANDEPAPEDAADAEGEEAKDGDEDAQESEESQEDQNAEATEKLMDGEGSHGSMVMDMNAAKEMIDDLNEAMQDLSSDLDREDYLETDISEAPLPYHRAHAENVNHPVYLFADLPSGAFFSSTSYTTWSLDLNQIFHGTNISFALSSATLNYLDNDSNINTYSFNPNTGLLEITFDNIFLPGQGFDLEVTAYNGSNTLGFDRSFDILKSTILNAASDNGIYREDGSYSDVNGNNSTVFLNNNFSNTNLNVFGDNNEIHMGENGNGALGRSVRLSGSAEGNHIIGGTKGDKIVVENADNRIETLGGNDNVVLDLSGGLNATLLDVTMGHNEFSYAQAFAHNIDPSSGGFSEGDHIQLENGGNLDLTNVGTLRGVEMIRYDSSNNQTLDLTVETVFDMADSNTLVIAEQGGNSGSSTLNLNGGTWTGRDEDGDSATDTISFGGHTYEIWDGVNGSGENVTLLIDTDVTIVT